MANQPSTYKFVLRLPPTLAGQIQRLATEHERSLNGEITMALRDYVMSEGPSAPLPSHDEQARAELDIYMESLRMRPDAVGDAVRAIDHADLAGLPPLEQYLASALAQDVAAGESEDTWLRHHLRTGWQPAIPGAPHGDAPNRLAQAVANLMDAGLWPW